jgi:hypothetical protein
MRKLFFESIAGARCLFATKVVPPRCLGSGQQLWFFAGRGLSSNLLSFLGGDAWRTPLIFGGDTQ